MTMLIDTFDRLLGNRRVSEAPTRLSTDAGGDGFPLLWQQERLWSHQHGPTASAGQAVIAEVRLAGIVDDLLLEDVLRRTIGAHESLRTSFTIEDGSAVQRVHQQATIELRVADLRFASNRAQEAQIRRAREEACRHVFDLSKAPLMDVALLKLRHTDHVLWLTVHRLVADRFSVDMLLEEILASYEARLHHRHLEIEAPALRVRDLVHHQRNGGARDVQDAEPIPELKLPLNGSQGSATPSPSARTMLSLPLDIVATLRALAEHEGVTLALVLFAAWATLLRRYATGGDVTIWVQAADRHVSGTERLVGCLEHRVPVRIQRGSADTFRTLLRRVHDAVVASTGGWGSVSGLALSTMRQDGRYDAGFTAGQVRCAAGQRVGQLVVTAAEISTSVAECDVELVVEEGQEFVHAELLYATDGCDPATAARMAGHLENLAYAVATEPDGPVDIVPVMTPAEIEWLMAHSDATEDATTLYPLHELFEEQVRRAPSALAIAFDGKHLTYAELNARSNQLAHVLTDLGLALEEPVAILLSNGPQQVAAMLAVLKAGGAFVCLDPVHPTKRLLEILKETDARLIIAESTPLARHRDLGGWVGRPGTALVQLDLDLDEYTSEDGARWFGRAFISGRPDTDLDRSVDPSATAYIVYTSGSTGKPKGIVQSHRSFCHFLVWQSEQFAIEEGERWAQWASVAYDASYCEVFGTLCFGATLCMAAENVRFDPAALINWVRREQITILQIVPSFCREVVDVLQGHSTAGEGHPLPSVRVFLLAGEVLPVDLAHVLLEGFSNPPALYNLYGPSETVLATFYEVRAAALRQSSISIGRAIRGRQILVLDERQQLCPIGVRGEIYIRSPYLSSGYFKQPAETAQRFVQNPLHDEFVDPVFRTGDMARWLPDGTLQFFGRGDSLVKLRGVRVELGDIDAAVRRHEAVVNCACVVRAAPTGRSRLVAKEREARERAASRGKQILIAYFTARRSISGSELRTFLERELPPHMIPQQLVQLEELPLNANRKLDVSALPEPEWLRPDLSKPYVAPRTEQERLLVGIWQEVLGLDRIGVDDGFFELGGDSLLAMQVLNRTRELTGVPIAFRALFEHRTIAVLAEQLEGPRRREERPPLGAGRDDTRTMYPLSRSQQGVWFLWQLEPDNPYCTAQGTIHLRGEVDIDVLLRAWEAVIDRHEILRTRFAMEAGEPVQIFDDRRSAALPFTDLSHLPAADRLPRMHTLASAKGVRALDLERDPLLQADLFKLGPEHFELLITFHEIILDLWGISVIVRDLGALYQGFKRGDDDPLPPPAVGFADYVLWERKRVRRETMVAEATFWREQLAGELPVLNLPTDRLRSSTLAYRGDARSIMLDAELTRALKTMSTRSNATLFMTLLSASYVLLQAYTGQDDLILGSPIANRTEEQTEQLVGFFLNMLPLRAALSDDPTFEDLLGQVRHTVTGAITHAEYPFMWMAEETRAARDTSVAPVFQVMFNMLNLPHTSHEFDGLSLSFSEVDTGYTKYDMSWYAQEHGDQLFFQIAYLTDLFDADTVDRMVHNFEVLLRNIAKDPGKRISQLSVLTEAEQRMVLETFNETDRTFPIDSCIHELFEEQVGRTPDATALVFQGESCTYAALNARANQLAWHLRNRGIGSGSPVGLCVSRSIDTLVTVLAVMKAGGTYVALEPTYPTSRLEAILRDAEPAALILHRQWDRFDDYSGAKVVLEDAAQAIAQQPIDNLPTITTPDNVLNVVYTSASTGVPKGTLITMRAVLNRLWWMWEDYPFQTGDVALLQKSYALVAATWECFGGLLRGIPTVILSHDEVIDPAAIWRRLVDHGVTHVLASPAFYDGILDQAEQHPAEWRTLRFASTSAEPIPPSMVARWRRAFPEVPLLNLYGSTECSSNVTAYDTSELPEDAERVPVGRPLPNTRVYVLDDNHRPVPLGAVGEMCVSGACLASGYLNLLSLTKEHFIANPYGDATHARLFRTGDLVRYRADGQLEVVGRKDHQVKIRGFRVELADIEEALRRHHAVRHCAVALRDLDGRKRLVAYVVRDDEPAQATLWRFLRDRLPDYMVPAHFVFLDSLPVTPNGKIDRSALPAPEAISAGAERVAPRTAAEDIVHRLWREVLGVDQFGVEENFFELGGHSLLATRLVSQLRDWFQLDMPVRALFENPTVAGVAEFLAGELGGYAVLEEIARTLLEVEQLSDDEVREQLANTPGDSNE